MGIRSVPSGSYPILLAHRVVGHAGRDLTRPASGSKETNAGNGIGVIAMFEMSQALTMSRAAQ
jgi:hypothetical protein